ncbi:MAG TPA: hypothetical protein PLN21_10235 [Gemmatales bacterium]|nr:hypothetical protein [Gemmatales bacterium]
MTSPFRLDKWYFDFVTEDGRVFIGYTAHVRWWMLTLNYYGYLYLDECHRVHHVNHFSKAPSSKMKAGELGWQVPGIDGVWHQLQPSVRETLLDNQQGIIDWQGVMPMARAEAQFQELESLAGLGYVEHISMTIPPWRLPITRLIWGRFITGSESIIWIRWFSPSSPKTLVFHNGARYDEATIEDDVICFGENSLYLTEPCCLREGSIGSTVLTKAGWIKYLFPKSILSLRENKWRSHGVFQGSSGQSATGWTIHESVDWAS